MVQVTAEKSSDHSADSTLGEQLVLSAGIDCKAR